MRIAYGVFGYGRGHATRALGVLSDLTRHHDVLLFAGGDAHETLSEAYSVRRVPAITYEYGPDARRSIARTVVGNFKSAADALLGGPGFESVVRAMREFRPDFAIVDCDPFVHHAAARLGVPRISFDHFGVLAFCHVPVPERDRLRKWRDVMTYHLLIGTPDRVLVSSFFDAPRRRPHVQCVGPLVRADVRAARPRPGEHLLAYLNNGGSQLTPRVEEALHAIGIPVVLYGTERRGVDRNVCFRGPDNRAFIEDLARSIAVFSTAGNQLVGEALHLGKPMLVLPEDTVEQRVNAAALERLGFGSSIGRTEITATRLQRFVRDVPRYREQGRGRAIDGTAAALALLQRMGASLVRHRSRQGVARSLGFA